jgi:hypothetical protein
LLSFNISPRIEYMRVLKTVRHSTPEDKLSAAPSYFRLTWSKAPESLHEKHITYMQLSMRSTLAYNLSYFYFYSSHARDREWSSVDSFYFSGTTTVLSQLVVHPLETIRNRTVASSHEVSINSSVEMCHG